ncbi:MAG: hypothetical protein AB7T06_27925 [Kofleriaceae bacterium]
MLKYSLSVLLLGCNMGPRVSDIEIDSSIPMPPDAPPGAPRFVLPPDAVVPSTADSLELQTQIQFNDGLVDSALTANGGVVVRGTGKSNGTTVRFWHFGPFVIDSFSVLAPVYIFGTVDTGGVFTPLPDHLPMLDTLPGDLRYSAIRRVLNVPVTDTYAGEKITSLDALNEAIDLGLVGDPIVEGTWINMPIVPPGTKLEVGPANANIPANKVYARGFLADAFEIGTGVGRQPLRLGIVDVRQASFLITGVPTGSPPIIPTTPDTQPVFQVTIPTVPPVLVPPAPNYSPLCQDVSVQLADGVAPADITTDADLFRRAANGTLNGYRPDNVESYTIGTVVNNIQIQFVEGQP